jgi:hypothetical protein
MSGRLIFVGCFCGAAAKLIEKLREVTDSKTAIQPRYFTQTSTDFGVYECKPYLNFNTYACALSTEL